MSISDAPRLCLTMGARRLCTWCEDNGVDYMSRRREKWRGQRKWYDLTYKIGLWAAVGTFIPFLFLSRPWQNEEVAPKPTRQETSVTRSLSDHPSVTPPDQSTSSNVSNDLSWVTTSVLILFAGLVPTYIILLRVAGWHLYFKSRVGIVSEGFDFGTSTTSKVAKGRIFEHQVAWVIHTQTGYRTQVVGGIGDKGVDIKIYNKADRLIGIVQCKAQEKTLPPAYIHELNSVRQQIGIDQAYLVTQGYFSTQSKQLAHDLGIKLVDGAAFKRAYEKLKAQESAPASKTS
jgi:hypothetical protein